MSKKKQKPVSKASKNVKTIKKTAAPKKSTPPQTDLKKAKKSSVKSAETAPKISVGAAAQAAGLSTPHVASPRATPVHPTATPFSAETFQTSSAETDVILTDAEGRRYCKVKECDQIANVETYCRFHYLLLWKRIQVRRKILMDGKLERFVEDMTARYPDKFLEMIRKDLRSEKDFSAAMAELELDESGLDNDYEGGDNESEFIDEVRSVGSTEGSGLVDDSDY